MMTKTMLFLTQTGQKFIIKMEKISGTKQKERLIMMVYIILNRTVVKVILFYSLKMPADLVKQISGVCTLKMNTFIFLLIVLLGGLVVPQNHRSLTPSRTPPGTPRLSRRLTDENRYKQRRGALGLPNHSQRSDEDEEEKENQQPTNDNEELVEDLVSRLLRQWGQAVDQLLDQISQDLQGFKKRLGIRP
uniref:E4 protein n=1 Tax=Human papillomavirus TaxID=10566 RepID=A0A385PIY4_9PAPI|nr:MAG: E4 protein [Human papillomavirus]